MISICPCGLFGSEGKRAIRHKPVAKESKVSEPPTAGKTQTEGHRPVCRRGAHCRRRDEAHLAKKAHPFDEDYARCCGAEGLPAEQLTIRSLFEWVDLGGDGQICRNELQKWVGRISDSQWASIDKDRDGFIEFDEFAKWAGPCLGIPLDLDAAGKARRLVCVRGAGCKDRGPAHLAAEAHPFDDDYQAACAALGREPEEATLKKLFDWIDINAGGTLSRDELQEYLPDITDAAWERLDKDGNGVINFGEFASWAGPRLGMPLGVDVRSAGFCDASPCGIVGCPCEAFEGDGTYCQTCKHHRRHHISRDIPGEVPVPPYWNNHASGNCDFKELVDTESSMTADVQALFDKTYKHCWTRDRTRHNPDNYHVPVRFRVVRVLRNENGALWQQYCVRRAQMLSATEDLSNERFHVYDNIKTDLAWSSIAGAKAACLASNINEWYLFHGTHPNAVQRICDVHFKMSLAGGNTGTLYGRGSYFSESITKADEYAKKNKTGNYAVLLCRILGGHVYYTDEVLPDPEDLVYKCIDGPYDLILGDREKIRGSYREFVSYDSENIYPEYVIEYKRVYADTRRHSMPDNHHEHPPPRQT